MLYGEVLVSMIDKVNGGWFAILNWADGIDKPLLARHCSSFDAGRIWAELWVPRHEETLREQVAHKLQWIWEHVAQHPASPAWSMRNVAATGLV